MSETEHERLTREVAQAAVVHEQDRQIIRGTRLERNAYYKRVMTLRQQIREALGVLRNGAAADECAERCEDVLARAIDADNDADDEAP